MASARHFGANHSLRSIFPQDWARVDFRAYIGSLLMRRGKSRLDSFVGISLDGLTTSGLMMFVKFLAALAPLALRPLATTVRVVGSWIGAIGLLMLGWAMR